MRRVIFHPKWVFIWRTSPGKHAAWPAPHRHEPRTPEALSWGIQNQDWKANEICGKWPGCKEEKPSTTVDNFVIRVERSFSQRKMMPSFISWTFCPIFLFEHVAWKCPDRSRALEKENRRAKNKIRNAHKKVTVVTILKSGCAACWLSLGRPHFLLHCKLSQLLMKPARAKNLSFGPARKTKPKKNTKNKKLSRCMPSQKAVPVPMQPRPGKTHQAALQSRGL